MVETEGTTDDKVGELTTLRIKLASIEKEYNKTRHELFNKVRSYYNQSIASSFITEDSILELLMKCERLKQNYAEINSEVLTKRPKERNWSFRDYQF